MYDVIVAPKAWSFDQYIFNRQKKSGRRVCCGHKWKQQSKCKQMNGNTNSRRAVQEAASRSRRKKAHPIIDYNKRTCAVIPKYTSRFIVSTRSAEPILLARPTVAAGERDEKRGTERE